MKKVFFTILAAFALVLFVASCDNDTSEEDRLYEQGIEKGEIKEGDI